MLRASFITDNECILVIKLVVNKDNLLLEMEGVSENYTKELKNYNKENIRKLQDRVNLFEGTLDINTSSDRNKIVVNVKLN